VRCTARACPQRGKPFLLLAVAPLEALGLLFVLFGARAVLPGKLARRMLPWPSSCSTREVFQATCAAKRRVFSQSLVVGGDDFLSLACHSAWYVGENALHQVSALIGGAVEHPAKHQPESTIAAVFGNHDFSTNCKVAAVFGFLDDLHALTGGHISQSSGLVRVILAQRIQTIIAIRQHFATR